MSYRHAMIAAALLSASAALANAQTDSSTRGTPADQSANKPSAVDTTGMGATRPGCGPAAGSPAAATAGSAPDATVGMRAPRIIDDPTVSTSETAETGLSTSSAIPKQKTARPADC
jgi:hypothetical protein